MSEKTSEMWPFDPTCLSVLPEHSLLLNLNFTHTHTDTSLHTKLQTNFLSAFLLCWKIIEQRSVLRLTPPRPPRFPENTHTHTHTPLPSYPSAGPEALCNHCKSGSAAAIQSLPSAGGAFHSSRTCRHKQGLWPSLSWVFFYFGVIPSQENDAGSVGGRGAQM